MQIAKNIYIDIEIVGMDISDFLTFADVQKFEIIETGGASLPYFYMKIIVREEPTKNAFVLNNKLRITFGENEESAETFNVDVHNVESNTDPAEIGWIVELSGFLGNRDYMVEQRTKAYPGNSLLVTDSVMKEYFGNSVINDFSKTNENQVTWRQNNTTACYFVADTLLHADLRPSFPLFSFDRYMNFHIRDIQKLLKEGPRVTFTPFPKDSNDIRYFNNFRTISYKPMYNLHTGYGRVVDMYDALEGKTYGYTLSQDPILAASAEPEAVETGNTYSVNNIQSSNVHNSYNAAYAYNVNKLLSLSSVLGGIDTYGYIKNVHPTDLVRVIVPDDRDPSLGGLYLVDTTIVWANFDSGSFHTDIFVTRDNKNNVENYVPKNRKRNWLNVRKKFMDAIVSTVATIKEVYAVGMKIIDGRFMQEMLSFALLTKNNVLRSFRITGVNIDFTAKENLLISLVAESNALLNVFCDMIFPEEIATTLKDAIIMGRSQLGNFGGRVEEYSTIALISNYVDLYVPTEIRSPIMAIIQSLYGIKDTLNSIAEDNGIAVSAQEGQRVSTEVSETNYIAEGQQRVSLILNDFENNTTGLDIPFPVITLTESQSLLPEGDLKNLVADETIQKLDDLGYLNNVDVAEFKSILLGEKPIDFNIIDAINKSAGNLFAYRFWGTYNSPVELVSFYIKKSYKDKFRTIPCTKLISALQNAKIFFACPSIEEDLRFYINSKRVELNSFEIDLGYEDIYGNPVMYTVYYTETGYNSSSVMLEVKQGGMV